MADIETSRCKGTTQAGAQCQRRAGATGYCHQHDPNVLADKRRLENENRRKGERLYELVNMVTRLAKAKGWDAYLKSIDKSEWRFASLAASRPEGYQEVTALVEIGCGQKISISVESTSFYKYGLGSLRSALKDGLGEISWLKPIESRQRVHRAPEEKKVRELDRLTKSPKERLEREGQDNEETYEPGYVFIVMAMPEDDPDAEDVHQTIARTCSDLGMKGERVDDIQFAGQITEKIQSSIRMAEIVVADLTHERPNVYYEVGYADAHNKPLVLLAHKGKGTKIHFDLQGNKVLFYRNMTELQKNLSKALPALRQEA